jgi:hypothetical protein
MLFTLVLASFAYTARVDLSVDRRVQEVESRVVTRLERIEDKLDRLMERR